MKPRRAIVTPPAPEAIKLMGFTMVDFMVGKLVYVNYEGDRRIKLFPYFVSEDDPDTVYETWGEAHAAKGKIPMTEDCLEFIDKEDTTVGRPKPKQESTGAATSLSAEDLTSAFGIAPEVMEDEPEKASAISGAVGGTISEDRRKSLDALCTLVNKDFGAGTLMRLGDPNSTVKIETTSTGSLTLDIATGGGYPDGRWIELFGDKSAGKTTVAILAAIEKLNQGREVVFIDGEHALNPEWAKMLGLDINQLLIHQPSPDPVTGLGGAIEDVYNLILKLARTGRVGLIIIDSLPSIPSRIEIGGEKGINEANFDDVSVAAQARKNSQATRMLTATLAKMKCTLLIINQNRDKIGGFSKFGTPKMQTGGHALEYAHSMKIEVKNAEFLKPKGSGEEAKFIGQVIKCYVVKNKIAAPYKEATFRLFYDRGIDRLDELYQMAKYLDILTGSGWLTLADTSTGEIIGKWNGEAKTKEAIIADPSLYTIIHNRIKDTIKGRQNAIEIEGEVLNPDPEEDGAE